MVCDRSSPDDGPRPTVGKTDAFQEDGEGAGLGEGITGQTHLSNLSRARAGAAAHDGAIGQSTRWMLAICLEPSAAHELASWRASRYATSLGSGPGVRTGKRRRGGSPGPEEKVRHGATRPMHKCSPGILLERLRWWIREQGLEVSPFCTDKENPGARCPFCPPLFPKTPRTAAELARNAQGCNLRFSITRQMVSSGVKICMTLLGTDPRHFSGISMRRDGISAAINTMRPNPVHNGSLVMSAGGPGPDAYWPWRPGSEGPSH